MKPTAPRRNNFSEFATAQENDPEKISVEYRPPPRARADARRETVVKPGKLRDAAEHDLYTRHGLRALLDRTG